MAAYTDYYGYYEPTTPIEVKGGIKAKSKRGSFAQSWWAKSWIKTLESFNLGARLGRGKSYARKGQVTSVKIEAGLVRAKVQGSDPKPYSVTIKVRTLTGSEWELLAEKLALKPIFTAKLRAGEMPEDIDSVFKESGLSLFPETLDDLETDCSCPDWSNPCKRIAAVYYLLGEEFDRDPFLIFKLRGVDMDDFMSILEKSFVPEAADHVAETGVLTEHHNKNETSPEDGISHISEPLPPIRKLSGAGSLKTLEKKKVLLLRLISLRFQPPFRKDLENFPSGEAKRICLKYLRKSTKKLHLQG